MRVGVFLAIAVFLLPAGVGGYEFVTSATCPAPEAWPLPELAGKTRKEIHETLGPPSFDMIPIKGEEWKWRCGLYIYGLYPNYGGDNAFDDYAAALAGRGVAWQNEAPRYQGLKAVKIEVYRYEMERSLKYILDLGVVKSVRMSTTPERPNTPRGKS